MGKSIFVSYKYADAQVQDLGVYEVIDFFGTKEELQQQQDIMLMKLRKFWKKMTIFIKEKMMGKVWLRLRILQLPQS